MTSPRTRLTLAAMAVAVAVAVGGSAPSVAQTVQFTPLGVECGPAFFPTLCIVDMSGDGKTLLFQDRVWTADGQILPIGAPASGYYSVTALSDDGSTVVGDILVTDGPLEPHLEAAIWLGGDQWRSLGSIPGTGPCGLNLTSAFDVSGDGSKVVGLTWLEPNCVGTAHGFQWTEQTGMVDLGAIVDGRASRGNAISADGNVIAGWSDSEFGSRLGAQIRNGEPWEWITPDGQTIQAGEALAVNSDGSVIVGGGYSANTGGFGAPTFEPWLWSEANGLIHLGTVKGLRGDAIDGQHYANDVSDDGSVAIGFDTLFNLGERWAFIWTKTGGIRMLQDYVRQNTDPATRAKICSAVRGPLQPCSKWDFATPSAISNDGKIIVGTGRNPAGNWEAFKITLPQTVTAARKYGITSLGNATAFPRLFCTGRMPPSPTESLAIGARFVPLDVTDAQSVAAFAFGLDGVTIDILINNAGVMSGSESVGALSFNDVEKVSATNTVLGQCASRRCYCPISIAENES